MAKDIKNLHSKKILELSQLKKNIGNVSLLSTNVLTLSDLKFLGSKDQNKGEKKKSVIEKIIPSMFIDNLAERIDINIKNINGKWSKFIINRIEFLIRELIPVEGYIDENRAKIFHSIPKIILRIYFYYFH